MYKRQGQAFDANYKRHVGDLLPGADGAYTVEVKPYSIVTVTSLDVTRDRQWTTPLPVEGERPVLDADPAHGVLWADGFDYRGKTVPVIGPGGVVTGRRAGFVDSRGGDTGADPLYTWDRNGAFEAVATADSGYVLRQQIDRAATGVGRAWNDADPITGVGDLRWTDYRASVDVSFERAAAADNYAAIGARSTGGGSSHGLGGTPYALRLGSDGAWQFRRLGATVTGGVLDGFDATGPHRLAIQVVGGEVTGFVDGAPVFTWTDAAPFLSGRVDLASGFHYTRFDNLRIERVPGHRPYYQRLFDNLETSRLVYGGGWRHANGRGMFEYQRSASISQGPGATIEHTFTGTGLDLIGVNDGSARLDVRVDGALVATAQPTRASTNFQQTFEVRGLPPGRHSVTLQVVSGTLLVDAVGVR